MNRTKRVSIALVRDHKDNVLFGLRSDSNRWTQPGGHLEEGECAYAGCVRELKEETGLDAHGIKLAKVSYNAKKRLMIYVFDVIVDPTQQIDPSNDPDKECPIWAYLDPNEVKEQLHVPLHENIALLHWINS